MNKNLHLCQIILLGLLISFVNTQQQPAKFHTNVLRYASTCREKVSSDSNITLKYVARILETNEIIESRILDLKPGELTVVKGLEQGIQGMCTGEIRRLSVPTSLHISNDGQVSNKAIVYDIEILKIQSPQIFTPIFWTMLSCMGVAYFVFGRLADQKIK